VDLLIRYRGKLYALEVKTFSNLRLYREALEQAARYAKSLGLPEISLVFFIDMLDEKNREKYETEYRENATGVTVKPLFIETGGKTI
jgi:Ribonuclease G/E